MWELQGNEKTQEQLNSYKRKLVFKKDDDAGLKRKTITLASVIYRMLFLKHSTCYHYEEGERRTHQCDGSRLRSVEDIYSVAKNYVKTPITREDVEKAIDNLIGARLVEQSYCSDVRRRVHYPKSATTTLTEIKEALGYDKPKRIKRKNG